MEYTKGEWYPVMVHGERRIIADKDDIEEVICYGVRHSYMYLICEAVNACIKLNPENPAAVAQSISDMYKALKQALRTFEARKISQFDARYILLAKALARATARS